MHFEFYYYFMSLFFKSGDEILHFYMLPCRQHSFVEFDHEKKSTVILSIPLIHEGQLSVSGERMFSILVKSKPTQ